MHVLTTTHEARCRSPRFRELALGNLGDPVNDLGDLKVSDDFDDDAKVRLKVVVNFVGAFAGC